MNYSELLSLAAPETILTLAMLAVLGVDLLVMRGEPLRNRRFIGALFGGFGCLLAIAVAWSAHPHEPLPLAMFVADPLTRLVKPAILLLTLFTLVLAVERDFTDHVGELYALVLLSALGMMFLVSTENLLMIFVALELTSLPLYVLTAFDKRNPHSAEAALRYFLFGGMAAAIALFGLSLVYGLSGSIELSAIATNLGGGGLSPLLAVALVMTVIGFGFKIAAVPFHLWAPDAYQGAPTPVAAFIASGSKVASFFILAKVVIIGFAGARGSAAWQQLSSGWTPLLATLATLSMLLGNLAAMAQTNVKRLLAYSAVAHGGYALLGIIAGNRPGVASLLYYVVTYGLAVLGAFAVVAVVEETAGGARLADFAGLSRRSPLLGACLMVFMLSLAGIPPLAGFFSKFYVFATAAAVGRNLGLLWLVIVAIATSAVSLYYYLQVLKQAYVANSPAGPTAASPGWGTLALITLLAAGVVGMGIAPEWFVAQFVDGVRAAGLR